MSAWKIGNAWKSVLSKRVGWQIGRLETPPLGGFQPTKQPIDRRLVDQINAIQHEIELANFEGYDWKAARLHLVAAWYHLRMRLRT